MFCYHVKLTDSTCVQTERMADSTSPQRPLTLSSAKWSALVGPMFKMPMGIFLSLAASKNLYPEYT